MNDTTLKTGKYTIKLNSEAPQVYAVDEAGTEVWLATVKDLDVATTIVEGLILVETKRFYYPESGPKFSPEETKSIPSFLQRKNGK